MVPQGGIIMWSGTIAEINDLDNWALCDGSTVDGVVTPNLRDRFIYGAGGSRSPNTFGAASASGTANGHALSREEVPTHAHSQLGETTANLRGGTTGTILNNIVVDNGTGSWTGAGGSCASGGACSPGNLNSLRGDSHSHSLSITSNEPDWYALAFIIRLK